LSGGDAAGRQQLLAGIREWYNGYNWDGPETVYNPFSVLGFFDNQGKFGNYWFASGTPSFLVKLLNEQFAFQFEGIQVGDPHLFDNFQLDNISATALLLQTGYLTIKEAQPNRYTLGYPNREVREAFLQYLPAGFAKQSPPDVQPLAWQLAQAFEAHDLERVVGIFNTIFANIPYQIFEEKAESYYQAILYLALLLMGYDVQAEVSTAKGRIDAVVRTTQAIYVIEFKAKDSARAALAQIRERRYYQKYLHSGLPVYLLGLACRERSIAEWKLEPA
jgi:hypothetical protein